MTKKMKSYMIGGVLYNFEPKTIKEASLVLAKILRDEKREELFKKDIEEREKLIRKFCKRKRNISILISEYDPEIIFNADSIIEYFDLT